MKPIVIIKETNKDGKFELMEKELKELIEKAYDQGFEDGKQYYSWFTTPPTITLNRQNPEPSYPHDIYGNPIPYCGGSTTSDSRDNRGTLTAESNDLVYRGWEHNYKFPKQAEPIPC